ncbi:hypothetical protein NDU88_012963 [Pleurodeles waltl]|uniref:Ig-like domain-containing protein n=2 Tax=Pleurodeles waltl TaxID=8319 RepID=A0AAV7R387_PLEWA|nr:hypothetical protein NDU88_012963 [Pleurodeles waltl]
MALLALLGARAIHGRETAVDFVAEVRSECRFLNGTQQVRYLRRFAYNGQQFVHFDSDLGYFVADTEFGEPDAKYWNSDEEFIQRLKAEVERFCRHNYDVFESSMPQRRLKPSVRLYASKTVDPKKPHRLTCNVNGFYPYGITVRWFKNGLEDPGVVSSELLQNGDWTAQIMVLLSTTIQHGDIFICEVEHISLEQPIRLEWKLQASESARNKMVTGIVGFVLGGIFITIGLVFYLKNKKGTRQFIDCAPEEANFMN